MTQDDIVKHISGPVPAQSKLSSLNLNYSSPSSSVAVVLLHRLLLLLLSPPNFMPKRMQNRSKKVPAKKSLTAAASAHPQRD